MKDFYDVIIVGSGPAGLGAAFHLAKNSNKSILMIDKLTMSSGGLRNDCKQNYTFPIGFPLDCWTKEQADELLTEVAEHLNPEYSPQHNLDTYINRAKKYNTELYVIKQCHVGTDKAKGLIEDLVNQLKDLGVDVQLNQEITEIDNEAKQTLFADGKKIGYGDLVLGVGRKGAFWLQDVMTKLGVNFVDNMVDIGVRIEMKEENYPIVKDYYDPKFWLPNSVRTFCTNSGAASVVKEKYEGYFSVNGHALSDEKTPNGLVNFAVLKTIYLTEPLVSGTEYARILGKAAMQIGGGKPIMQRVSDLRAGKRSKLETFNHDIHDFEPTLRSCTPGDITLAMPAKIFRDIWDSLKTLDSIVYGVLSPSTIIYYPEIKTYSNKPVFIDQHFKIKENIYAIGDGAGTSRGITGAWASGIRVARGILK